MLSNCRDKTLTDLKQELTSLGSRAKQISAQFEALRREAESSKIEFLQHYLEEHGSLNITTTQMSLYAKNVETDKPYEC